MRYLKVADVPAFLADLAQAPRSQGMPLFQTLIWQNKWITETDKPIDGAAVLSYRWRTRANEETVSDFLQWLEDLGQVGYQPCQLRQEIQRTPELWTVADALPEVSSARGYARLSAERVHVLGLWCAIRASLPSRRLKLAPRRRCRAAAPALVQVQVRELTRRACRRRRH